MSYSIYHFTEKDVINRSSFIPEEENQVIVETAGFIPFDVRFKQMEQNGIVAKLREQDFSLSIQDLRQLYFGEATEITQYDDIEDVEEKLLLQRAYKQKLYEDYLASLEKNPDQNTPKNPDQNTPKNPDIE